MGTFNMPSLGADMAAGTLIAWKVGPGDHVHRGDIIAEVETDKATVEVEVFESGVVDRLLVLPGTKVPVGTPLAELRSDGAAVPSEIAVPPGIGAVEFKRAPAPIRASPLARRIAAELGVDLATITGTGPGGAIEKSDVEAAARPRTAEPPLVPAIPSVPPPLPPVEKSAADNRAQTQDRMREAIAAAMARSKREIPHYYLQNAIDMSRALKWLEQRNAEVEPGQRILPAVLLVKGVAHALAEVPELNGYWVNGEHQLREEFNIGVAISLRQGGLIAPAVHNVDTLSLDELMAAMSDLIVRARAGRLRSSEMTDATVTVTNLGDLGVDLVHGIIYPPQLALVGFGRIAERPWAQDGLLGVRPVVHATLAADHRATDGHRGGRFLDALAKILQRPEEL